MNRSELMIGTGWKSTCALLNECFYLGSFHAPFVCSCAMCLPCQYSHCVFRRKRSRSRSKRMRRKPLTRRRTKKRKTKTRQPSKKKKLMTNQKLERWDTEKISCQLYRRSLCGYLNACFLFEDLVDRLFTFLFPLQVEKTTWDWELMNSDKPIWTRKWVNDNCCDWLLFWNGVTPVL